MLPSLVQAPGVRHGLVTGVLIVVPAAIPVVLTLLVHILPSQHVLLPVLLLSVLLDNL